MFFFVFIILCELVVFVIASNRAIKDGIWVGGQTNDVNRKKIYPSQQFLNILANREIENGTSMMVTESIDGYITEVNYGPQTINGTQFIGSLQVKNRANVLILQVGFTKERIQDYTFNITTTRGTQKTNFEALHKGQKIKTTVFYKIDSNGNAWGPAILNNKFEVN